jgi:peroxiredoxin
MSKDPSEVSGVDVGDAAPAFRAPSSHGQTLELASFLGKVPVVVFLLPGADREDALAEIKQWDERLIDFGHARVQVLGVLPDGPATLRELVRDDDLTVTLLSDESGEMERSYAARIAQGEGMPTVVIDRDGKIVSLVPRSRSASHPEEVLAAVQRLRLEHPGDMEPTHRF